MKTRLIVLSLLAVVAVASTSAVVAYHFGYRQGGEEERACWTIDPVSAEAWVDGEITARRDTRKHPFLKSRLELRSNRSVNSIPTHVRF
jgi:hypothetical protein